MQTVRQNINNYLSILPVFFFPLLPLVSVLFSVLIILYNNKEVRKYNYYIFFILLALYLGFINGSKVPESDLIYYIQNYSNAGKFPFWTYILIHHKEPGFFIYNYITYYLFFGNVTLYLIVTTFISYILLFVAVYKYYHKIYNKSKVIIFSILIVAFFPQLFSLSAQIMRQFMAGAILVYAMVQKFFYGKKAWYYLLLAALIHSSVIFFIPFIYFKLLEKRFSFKLIFILTILAFIIKQTISPFTAWLLNKLGYNFLTYVFVRASEGTISNLKPISLLGLLTLAILVVISVWYQFFYTNDLKYKNSFIHFNNIFLVLVLFVLASFSMVELSKRFFFFSYFFLPFIFPLFFTTDKVEYKALRTVFLVSFFLFFVYRLQFGTWQYASLPQLLFGNIFNYFL